MTYSCLLILSLVLVSVTLSEAKEGLFRGLKSSTAWNTPVNRESHSQSHSRHNLTRDGLVILFDGSQGSSYFIGAVDVACSLNSCTCL